MAKSLRGINFIISMMTKTKIILILLFSFCINIPFANGNVIEVGKNYRFTTITGAISAAKNGDTILVHKGIYHEGNIILDKKILLEGIDQPVLDGDKKFEIISVKADNVTVKGLILQHTGFSSMDDIAAIKLSYCRNALICNNKIDDACFGIYAEQAVSGIVRDNELTAYGKAEESSGNGVHCWKSDSMQIIHNSINGFRDGIYFEFVTNSVIWRNINQNCIRYGLHFMFSHNDAYITNIFRRNGAGVAVMFTHGVRMFNNSFEDNNGEASFGLLMKEITDSYILGNHFINNTQAVFMEGSSRIQLQKNLFKNNGWALKIQASCLDVTVTGNDYINNTFDVSTNGTLMLNTFNNNYWDKYEGYDLNKDKIGDIPYRPVSMYSMMVEQNPTLMMLFRSFITTLMDKTEKVIPSLIPQDLKDDHPLMKPLAL